jgi:hypothetical protein
MFKTILVLESPWDPHSVKSKSVWPFVNEFANVYNIAAHHQMFTDKLSFQHWVQRFHKEKLSEPKLLYVAAHGGAGRIGGLKKDINGTTIVEACKKAKSIKYIHFGSCLFGTEDNLSNLLKSAKHLQWAAGYDKEVAWVDSTLFDVMLWGRIGMRDCASTGKKFHTIAKELLSEIPGLAKNLGFRFQYRYGKAIKPLIYTDEM